MSTGCIVEMLAYIIFNEQADSHVIWKKTSMEWMELFVWNMMEI